MNVYDFDGTIYRGDCSVDFYVYCLFRFPWIIVCLPYQLLMIALYKIGICSKESGKSSFFVFLRLIPSVSERVNAFWSSRMHLIYPWYLKQQRTDDVIISASPYFLLHPLCKVLHLNFLLASYIDSQTGAFCGRNCYGKEKLRRFRECFPNERINEFYSDSMSDLPMAMVSEKAFYVKKDGSVIEWKNDGTGL